MCLTHTGHSWQYWQMPGRAMSRNGIVRIYRSSPTRWQSPHRTAPASTLSRPVSTHRWGEHDLVAPSQLLVYVGRLLWKWTKWSNGRQKLRVKGETILCYEWFVCSCQDRLFTSSFLLPISVFCWYCWDAMSCDVERPKMYSFALFCIHLSINEIAILWLYANWNTPFKEMM